MKKICFVVFIFIFSSCEKNEPDQIGKDGWIGTYKLKRVLEKVGNVSPSESFTINNWPRCTIPPTQIDGTLTKGLPGMVHSDRVVVYSAKPFDGATIVTLNDTKDSVKLNYSFNNRTHRYQGIYIKE